SSAIVGGGGILGDDLSSIVLMDSTVSGNSATGDLGDGGGVYARSNASVTLIDATLSGNSASYDGGAVYGFLNSAVTLVNTTVTGNHAGLAGGGIYDGGSLAVVALANSIVAGNMADQAVDDLAADAFGTSSSLVLTGGNVLASAPVNFAQVSDVP